MKQKHQDGIRAEAFAYVCQLQQSAAMLAPLDSDKEDESNYTSRSNDDTSSSYKHESERVSFFYIIMKCNFFNGRITVYPINVSQQLV
jgi:hypothetical protein